MSVFFIILWIRVMNIISILIKFCSFYLQLYIYGDYIMNNETLIGYNKKNLKDVDVENKIVFVRVDFNVPLNEYGLITDDNRIKSSLETIKYLIDNKAKIILASHMGRPKGKIDARLSLFPVSERLSELLNYPVKFVHDCIGDEVQKAKEELKSGDVLLLENLRFHPEEKKNEHKFISKLAENIDIFVNDAFGTSHRNQASMTGVPTKVPLAVTGFLVKKELEAFSKMLSNPKKPFIAILGGAKVSDKITVIQKLFEKVDTILIGGGMAYTFLKALKFDVGNSLVENDRLQTALDILAEAKDLGIEFLLPVDNIVANKMDDEVKTSTVKNENIPSSWMALDIGHETVALFSSKIKKAKTIFWNGPMGVFEKELFRKGTLGIAKAVADSPATSIVGGGDSVAAIKMFNLENKIDHISTGGGASIELVQGKILPGIEVLTNA